MSSSDSHSLTHRYGIRMTPDVVRSDGTTPFRAREVPPRSLFERLLRRSTGPRARLALENLLASAAPSQITSAATEQVRRENCLAENEWRSVCHQAFGTAYHACVKDDLLSEAEVKYLADLRRLLDIGEDVVAQLERETILPRYRAALAEVLADNRVTSEERARLDALSAALRLSPAIAREAFATKVGAVLQSTLEAALADRRLTPEEFLHFSELAKEFGIEPSFGDATLKLMHRYSLFWRIEQGDIPVANVPINLQKGEVCYFSAPARWLEYRKQVRTVGYYSQGVSVRVMRGVYYRVGGSRPQRVTTEGLTALDTGVLYITNKRLIFDGTRRNLSLKLNTLLSFEAFSDGLALEKSSGKSPHFILDGDAELANVILGAVLARS